MKVTGLYVYPIKSLRGIRIDSAELGPQGIKHDRRFMICRVDKDGILQKIQHSGYPECGLFDQKLDPNGTILVRYLSPEKPLVPASPLQDQVLEVPLEPKGLDTLERAEVNLHQSLVNAYRMGKPYDDWFSACFGFETVLLYIGDERRPVLGTFSPRNRPPRESAQPADAAAASKGWLSSIATYVMGGGQQDGEEEDPDWLNFSDCAPYLIATQASLDNVTARLSPSSGPMDMYKFRPNIIIDGASAFDEDFWAELSLNGRQRPTFCLTKMCGRCTSVNVDYATGRPAEGERGTVLKKLMSDRRVDPGNKYSPVFGKYAFLADGAVAKAAEGGEGECVRVGDEVEVTKRMEERPKWDWPMSKSQAARFYVRA